MMRVIVVLLVMLFGLRAEAQTLTQNVRLIVPFAPGGTVDILGRLLAEHLTPMLGGRLVVVENRSGAGTFIAMQAVANAPPDGHTLSLAATANLANAPIIPGSNLPIDPDQALLPLTNLVRVPMMLVGQAGAPYTNLTELIAYARANPGRLNIGNAGAGGMTHLLAVRMMIEARITMESVQYRGGTPALMDIMAGNAHLYFSLLPESLPFIRDGRLRAIASASAAREAVLPDVGLIRDVLPGFVGDVTYGMVMAAGTPDEWVTFWHRAIGRALEVPAVQERMRQLLWQSAYNSPAAYRAEILETRRTWEPVIRAAGIREGG